MSFAGAFDLEVPNGSLRVNRRKARGDSVDVRGRALRVVSYGKLPMLL